MAEHVAGSCTLEFVLGSAPNAVPPVEQGLNLHQRRPEHTLISYRGSIEPSGMPLSGYVGRL